MKALHLLAATLFLVSVSCERHDWEETKALHEQHGHAAHADGHGDAAHVEEPHGDAGTGDH
ncbi:hypothetical protein [Haloferula sp. A504]|uniref:hypothetical protein n=1 Tax=Haloferula sp. A504 TaxID=3373601 RepID=UPI0031BD8BFD|nr:hypothetical protein [Verrucomicrobiaceae bacterium E54]